MKLAIVGSALSLLFLGTAGAQGTGGKYKRTQDVKIDVKLSDRVKPTAPKAPDKKDTQPSLSADDVLSIEGLVGNIRGERQLAYEPLAIANALQRL